VIVVVREEKKKEKREVTVGWQHLSAISQMGRNLTMTESPWV
jgi:hypothetical protein